MKRKSHHVTSNNLQLKDCALTKYLLVPMKIHMYMSEFSQADILKKHFQEFLEEFWGNETQAR